MAEPIFSRIGSVVSTEISAVSTNFQNQIDAITTGGGVGFVYHEVTENTTATSASAYIVCTGTTAITLTLPAAPTIGAQVKIIDADNNASINNITVARNSSNIMGFAEDLNIGTDSTNLVLVYINATRGWIIG